MDDLVDGDGDDVTLLGEVSIKRVDQQVWLGKVPRYISKAWEGAPASSEIGRLQIMDSDSSDGSRKVRLLVSGARENVPVEHDLVFFPMEADEDVRVLSEKKDGTLAFEGQVTQRVDIKPSDTVKYRQLMFNRSESAKKSDHVVVALETKPRIAEMVAMQTVDETTGTVVIQDDDSDRERKPEKKHKEKRDRIEREELNSILFTLFEKHRFLGLRDLSEATQQPQAFLKEVLGELCVYHKKGTNKNFYELKAQYQK